MTLECWTCGQPEGICDCLENGEKPILLEKQNTDYGSRYLQQNGELMPLCGDRGDYDITAYPKDIN